jgi:hypothetical protein
MEFHDVYTTEGAADVLYVLLKERSSESGISHRECPSWTEHLAFVESRPYWRWYLISTEDEWLGAVNITMRNEIGIQIFSGRRDEGWGRKALEKLLATEKPLVALPSERPGYFVANISPLNDRSIYLFESLGFKHIQATYSYEP